MYNIGCLIYTIVAFCLETKLTVGFTPSLVSPSMTQSSRVTFQRKKSIRQLHDPVTIDPTYLELEALRQTSSILVSLLQQKTDPETARGTFYFALGAGSGAGGIGVRQIPEIISRLDFVKSLKDMGPSQGGDVLNTGAISGLLFPTESLYQKDVEKVISSMPSSSSLTKEISSEAYFAKMGYVGIESFSKGAVKRKCNPLASYAVFEALSGGKGAWVSPDVVDEKLNSWKSDGGLKLFISDFQSAALTRLSSYAGLAFLLFISLDFIVENYIYGFLQ